jgi:hypothetical protein
MSTCAAVRAAWSSLVFAQTSITALTDKALDYDVVLASTKEVNDLRYELEINAFVYLVNKQVTRRMMGQITEEFTVSVRYYRESDPKGENYNTVIDAQETVYDVVISTLGATWNNTVDYFLTQDSPINVSQQTIDGRAVWVSEYRYSGFKNS